jgi:hypothetical protein
MADPDETPAPPPDDVDRMERALGWRPTAFRPAAADRGTAGTAARWIVVDGRGPRELRRSAFVKIGATDLTAGWFRSEYRNYRSLHGWFLPEVLGFDDDGVRPALALEDLSAADWPPPWTDDRVAAVLGALRAIHETPAPDHLLRHEPDGGADWRVVGPDPRPFLALGLCSADWLDAALPALTATASGAPLVGNALVHMDIRSDNPCFPEGRAIVVDWNHAQVANPDLDTAFWLPSLHAEGGPPPEAILPNAPGLAAWVAGFFCARAGGAPIPEAPHVRPLQVLQSGTALPWAARALRLPPP